MSSKGGGRSSPKMPRALRSNVIRQQKDEANASIKRKSSLRNRTLLQSTPSTSKATELEKTETGGKLNRKKIEKSSSLDSDLEPLARKVPPKSKQHTQKKDKPKSPPPLQPLERVASFSELNEELSFEEQVEPEPDVKKPPLPVVEFKKPPSPTTQESMPNLEAPEIEIPMDLPLAPVQRFRIEFMADDQAASQVSKQQRKRFPTKQKVDSFCQTEGGNINEPLAPSTPRFRPQDMIEVTSVKVHKSAFTAQLLQELHNEKGSKELAKGLGFARGSSIEAAKNEIPMIQFKPSRVLTTPRTQVENLAGTSTQAGAGTVFNDDFESLLNEINTNDFNTTPQPMQEDNQFGSFTYKHPIPKENIFQQHLPTFQLPFEGKKDLFAIDADERMEIEHRKDIEQEFFGFQLDDEKMIGGASGNVSSAGEVQVAKTDSKCESSEPHKAQQKAEKRPPPDLIQLNPKKKAKKDPPMFARTSILEQEENTPQPTTSRFERPGQRQSIADDASTPNDPVSSPPTPAAHILPFTNACQMYLDTGACNRPTCRFEHKEYVSEELRSHLLTLEPLLMWDIIKHISNYRLAFLTHFPLFCEALGERGMRIELIALFPVIERPAMPNYDVNYKYIFRGLIRAGLTPVAAASAVLEHHKKRTHKALDAIIMILLETGPEAIVFIETLDTFASLPDYEFPYDAIAAMMELQGAINDANWFKLLLKVIGQLPEAKRALFPPAMTAFLAEAAVQVTGQELPGFSFGEADEGGDAMDYFGYDEEAAEAEENAVEWWTGPY